MFDSLADRMKRDDRQEGQMKERVLRWAVVAVASAGLFYGLYMGVRLLEY